MGPYAHVSPMVQQTKQSYFYCLLQVYVPDDLKDDKYWARRKKNNTAAKRSRDARRIKENQIALRAAFLEKQISNLQEDLRGEREENQNLRKRLEKYEGKS